MAAPPALYASASLYVGDLLPDVTEAALYEVFNTVGPVASIRVCRDSTSRRSLGYAYVNYHSVTDAERALDTLNFSNIKGQPCRIMWCHRDPALRKSGSGNIFVKNLDKSIDHKALYDTFSLFGNILSCKVQTDEAGRSLGFGFVHYDSETAAQLAIERVNGMQIGQKLVFVGIFQKRNDRSSKVDEFFTNVYARNFPDIWTETTLQKVFGEVGEVTSVKIEHDSKGRPFGFVNYATGEAARSSVEKLNNRRFDDNGILPEDAPVGAVTAAVVSNGTASEQSPAPAKEAVPAKSEEVKLDVTQDSEKPGDSLELPKPDRLYVARFQSKAERLTALKTKADSPVKVPEAKSRSQGMNLYIKNLDDQIDDDKLREAFEPFGTVTSAKIMYDDKGRSRGFGFVCFASPEEATRAVTDMHLKIVNNKPLYVGIAEKRTDRHVRLQHRYRMPPFRPSMPAIPPQMQYNPAPVYFGSAPGGMQVPPHSVPQRPMMGFNQPAGGMLPWRPGPRPYGPQGGMVPPQMPPMYPQMGDAGVPLGGAPAMGSSQRPPRQMQRPHHPVGGPNKGAVPVKNGAHPAGPGQAHNFRLTAQARNVQGPMPDVPHVALDGGMATSLQGMNPEMQKRLIGEKLFPLISAHQPELAGKITGMMLEMENSELLILLGSQQALKGKIEEALRVLQHANTGPQ